MSHDVVKAAPPPAPTFLDLEPEQLVERAVRISAALHDVVRRGNMISIIQGKEYVKVEGWNAMGSLLGLTVHVAGCRELEDGSFEAMVEIRTRGSVVLASASARCGMDEARWRSAPAFSRRSMAITRATGKAYRIGFSWVMALGGMAETPAEDMPQFDPGPQPAERRPHPASAEPFRVQRRDGTKGGAWDGQWPRRDQ